MVHFDDVSSFTWFLRLGRIEPDFELQPITHGELEDIVTSFFPTHLDVIAYQREYFAKI